MSDARDSVAALTDGQPALCKKCGHHQDDHARSEYVPAYGLTHHGMCSNGDCDCWAFFARGYTEAVVPLPHGGTIPVKFNE